MIPSFAASLSISLAIGILLTISLLPHRGDGIAARAFVFFAGGGLGIGMTSCLYFIGLLNGFPHHPVVIDLAVCLLLGVLCFIVFKQPGVSAGKAVPHAGKRSRLPVLLGTIFCAEFLASLASFIIALLKEPHGKWDAWLIWNMHARFLFRGGGQWRDAFSSKLDWSHWDYPLLLPLSIARGWQYSGGESLPVPAVMALLFTLMTLGLLLSALCLVRGRSQGFLAAMILLGTPFFTVMGASQFADVPLAFFMLATLVLLLLHARSPENQPGPLILAGVAAGFCCWTKNEGLLFLTIVTAVLGCTAVHTEGWRSALKRAAGFLAGAVPVLLIVIYFKTQLSPPNDLMAGFGPASAAAKLTDPGRYAEVAKAFFITGLSFTQGLIDIRVGMRPNPGAVNILLLAVYLFLMGIRVDRRDRVGLFQSAAALGLTLIGYFFVYVLTPIDLGYHLTTSLNRLFLQLWPSVILVCFMIAGPPETFLPDGPETVTAPPEKGSRGANKPKKTKEPI